MISVVVLGNRLKRGLGQVEIVDMNRIDLLTGQEDIADTCLAGPAPAGALIGPAWDRGLAQQAEQEAHRLFARVIQAWAMDVLLLRASGLDAPCDGNRGYA